MVRHSLTALALTTLSSSLFLCSYLDTHWYPALNGQASEADPAIQQQLLQMPRNLYDPTFKDPTNNVNPITKSPAPALFRQMHSWLAEYAPLCHIDIAVTEYAFGGARLHTTALALAEVFSIMAREDVAVSTLFQTPASNNAIYDSYRLYADYDGSKAGVTGDSVAASSTANVDHLTVYAQHDATRSTLFVKLFNKNTTSTRAAVTLNHIAANASSLAGTCWQLDGSPTGRGGISQAAAVTVSVDKSGVGTFSIDLSPRTATVVVIKGVSQAERLRRHERAARVKQA